MRSSFRLLADIAGKYLHWVETSARTTIRGGLEDLPERIDLGVVTDIVPHAAANASTPRTPVSRHAQTMSSASLGSLGFTLLSGDTVLADLQALDANLYSEWLDGLSLLRPDGVIFTADTANLVQSLTELGVKLKLLCGRDAVGVD